MNCFELGALGWCVVGMVGWCVGGDSGMVCGWGWWGGKEADYERQNVSIITI